MGALRKRLVRKVHGLLGLGPLHEQLQQTNELLRRLSLMIGTGEMKGPSPVSSGGLSLDINASALRSLANHGLFVVGCARSGTTILTRCLNCAPEVMLLDEPYFFLHEDIADFAQFFNDRQASMGNRRQKGAYVPPAIVTEYGPLGLLCRLRRHFQYVGEKVAFGPQEFPPDWRHRYLDFQSKYFLNARYLFIVRTPAETLWSMHKMFPEAPLPRLFETWLRTVALSLDAYQFFANSKVVFFDNLGPALLDRLADWLQVPIRIPPGTLGDRYIQSALSPGELPEPLLAFEELCTRSTEIYDDLRTSFSQEDFVYKGGVNQWSFFHDVHARIDALLTELAAPATATRSIVKQFVVRGTRLRAARRPIYAALQTGVDP